MPRLFLGEGRNGPGTTIDTCTTWNSIKCLENKLKCVDAGCAV